MATLIQFLEVLANGEPAITVPAEEVERLVARFGDRVRQMGQWNASGDGSLEIPMSVVREAATQLGSPALNEAVRELKGEQFTQMLEFSSAVSLIERVTDAYSRHFRDLMSRYQDTVDPAESSRLRDRLVREIFGA